MVSLETALANLAEKITGKRPTTLQVESIIQFMADNYPSGGSSAAPMSTKSSGKLL